MSCSFLFKSEDVFICKHSISPGISHWTNVIYYVLPSFPWLCSFFYSFTFFRDVMWSRFFAFSHLSPIKLPSLYLLQLASTILLEIFPLILEGTLDVTHDMLLYVISYIYSYKKHLLFAIAFLLVQLFLLVICSFHPKSYHFTCTQNRFSKKLHQSLPYLMSFIFPWYVYVFIYIYFHLP